VLRVWIKSDEELRYSIVVHLWEKIASTFGCHVKEAPKRIDKIAGAMVSTLQPVRGLLMGLARR
jgi:hypothetical protein